MAELVDAPGSGPGGGNTVEVRVLFSAPEPSLHRSVSRFSLIALHRVVSRRRIAKPVRGHFRRNAPGLHEPEAHPTNAEFPEPGVIRAGVRGGVWETRRYAGGRITARSIASP